MATLATNKKAYHDYTVIETMQAGIELTGGEVKSAKHGRIQLKDSFVRVNPSNEVFLYNCYIAPYGKASQEQPVSDRPRKLLLNADEIAAIRLKHKAEGLTIIPLKVYTTARSLIKVQIALAKGQKKHDKKRKEKEAEMKKVIKKTLQRYK